MRAIFHAPRTRESATAGVSACMELLCTLPLCHTVLLLAVTSILYAVWRMPSVHCQDKNSGPVPMPMGAVFGCLHCSGAPFPIVSCLLLYRKGHKSEMQKQESRAKIRAISCKSEL